MTHGRSPSAGAAKVTAVIISISVKWGTKSTVPPTSAVTRDSPVSKLAWTVTRARTSSAWASASGPQPQK